MERANGVSNGLVEKLKKAVDDNLTNEQFGVEDLSRNIGMSRSQLHRRLHAVTGQSVSQFVREYRLQLGMALLLKGDLTAAEVADRVGFRSATYFSKCFNEYYGFPPGEAKNRTDAVDTTGVSSTPVRRTPQTSSRNPLLLKVLAITAIVFVALFAVYVSVTTRSKTNANTGKSVAILPFSTLSQNKQDEYFTEGVMEAIRTGLSQVSELRVISRTSMEQYRSTDKSAGVIAGELGVSALLEGSVQRRGNRVRIDVRLVDGRSESLVWTKTFDREMKDVFAIQREIARQVADELHVTLSLEERSRMARTETENPRAYDLYLKAVYEYRTYTNGGAHRSIALLEEALALDSNYARAYAFLANSYIALATIFGAELGAVEALQKGKPLIDKALAIDPQLAEGHMLLGFYRLYHDWDFEGAEAEYKLAVASGHPDAIALYIDLLHFMTRHDEGLFWAERLNETHPYYPNSRMVQSYIFNGRFAEALEFSESRLRTFNNYLTLDAHGFLLLNMRRYTEAVEYFNKAISLEGIRYPRMLGWIGAAYARSGSREKAENIIDELKVRLAGNEKGSVAFFIAVIYAALDEKEPALLWLQTAYRSHDMEMPWLMTEPQFYSLHNDPDFQEVAARVGF